VADLLGQRLVQRVRQEETWPQGAPGRAGPRRSRASRLHRSRSQPALADHITEHPTGEGKLYLCAVKDEWSNRIVGYSIADRMQSSLAVAARDSAVARRGGAGQSVTGCLLHSDRGSQFRARKLQQALTRHDMIGSMGQVGSAGDNAAMESFFSLLQKNVLNRQHWRTRQDLRIAIVTWIERTYHRRRRQAALCRLTPIEYELIMTQTANQAA
jgi:transposase InsO family protein